MFPFKKKELQPFCFEHLSEMMPDGDSDSAKAETAVAYACSQLDCLINYNASSGYFIATKEGDRVEQRTMPGIHCPNDGTPMYLAEINPEHKSYRLWKCPQCRKSVTNLESMQARGQSA